MHFNRTLVRSTSLETLIKKSENTVAIDGTPKDYSNRSNRIQLSKIKKRVMYTVKYNVALVLNYHEHVLGSGHPEPLKRSPQFPLHTRLHG
jgi:hypothetical protein